MKKNQLIPLIEGGLVGWKLYQTYEVGKALQNQPSKHPSLGFQSKLQVVDKIWGECKKKNYTWMKCVYLQAR